MTTQMQPAASPRDTFLTVDEIGARYRWGRTKAYEMTKSKGFPRPIGGAYRLDTLYAWDDRVFAGELTGKPDPKPRKTTQKTTAPAPAADTALTAEKAQALLTAPDYVDPTKRRRGTRSAD